MTKTLPVLLGAVLALSGCATTTAGLPTDDFEAIHSLVKTGQCDAAERRVAQSTADAGAKALALGGISGDCRHDRAMAIRHLNLSARYGNETARHVLVTMGQPVPPADLAQQPNSQQPILLAPMPARSVNTTCIDTGSIITCSTR
jgi:hypothetical protein